MTGYDGYGDGAELAIHREGQLCNSLQRLGEAVAGPIEKTELGMSSKIFRWTTRRFLGIPLSGPAGGTAVRPNSEECCAGGKPLLKEGDGSYPGS